MPPRSGRRRSEDEPVTIDEAVEFARSHHRGVLATRRNDGRPQMSPIVAGIDAAGRVAISSRETAYKVKNLRRDPSVSLCLFQDRFFGSWVQIDGTAEIVSLPEAMESLIAVYRSIAGEHGDWDDFRRAMVAEQRVVIVIHPEYAGPTLSG